MLRYLSDDLAPIAGTLPSNVTRSIIPDGVKGTSATIAQMQQLASNGKRNPLVLSTLSKILSGQVGNLSSCPNKDFLCYVKNIYLYGRDTIRYVYDSWLVEVVRAPDVTIKTKMGDCDCNATLMVTLAEAAGFQAQYVTLMADSSRPDEYSHVYMRVNIPNQGWYVLDPTMPTKWFGWEAPTGWKKRYWPGSTDDLDLPLDTSDSVKVSSPNGVTGSVTTALTGLMSGLSRLAGLGCGCATVSGLSESCCGCSGEKSELDYQGKPEDDGYAIQYTNPGIDPSTSLIYSRGGALNGMAGLSSLTDDQKESWLADIISGTTLSQIQAMSAQNKDTASQLDAVKVAVAKMSPGPNKNQATQALAQGEQELRKQFVSYAQARDKYNEAAYQINRNSFGVYTVAMANLGNPILLIAAVAAAIVALSILISSWKSSSENSIGYIQQAANLAQQAGVTIEKLGDFYVKVAMIAAAGFAAYMLYQNKDSIRGLFKRA